MSNNNNNSNSGTIGYPNTYSSSYNWGYSTNATTTNHPVHTHSIGNHTHTINTSDLYYNGTITADFIKMQFRKGDVLKKLYEGDTIDSLVSSCVDIYDSGSVVDFLYFLAELGELNFDRYWNIVSEVPEVYICHTQYHELNKCMEHIENTKNRNLINFTRKDIREQSEFKNRINLLKLKMVF